MRPGDRRGAGWPGPGAGGTGDAAGWRAAAGAVGLAAERGMAGSLRRRQNAGRLRAAFTALVHRLDVSPPVMTAGRGEAAEAVAAMGEAAGRGAAAAGHLDARAVAVAGGGGGVARGAAGGQPPRRGCAPRPGIWCPPCDRRESRWPQSDVVGAVPMSACGYEEELAARAARARDVALFRYAVIRAAADPGLPPRQRGLLVRELAAGQHKDPAGQPVRIGRSTLDRWIRTVGGRRVRRPGPGRPEGGAAHRRGRAGAGGGAEEGEAGADRRPGHPGPGGPAGRRAGALGADHPAAFRADGPGRPSCTGAVGDRRFRPVRGRRTRGAVGLRRAARPAGRRRRQDVPVRHRG